MNVTKLSFHSEFPNVLRAIANAQFVAFDLELSGIPAGAQRKRKGPEKQTLQERYAEMKTSAETFNVLQVGLACVEEDQENGRYNIRAFNFNLSPMMLTNLVDMDRTFTYSASAVDFLLRSGYQLDSPFVHGVPYLAHDEAVEMKRLLEEKLSNLKSIPDIPLAGNQDAQTFTKKVKDEIDIWLATSKPIKHYHIIEPIEGSGQAGLNAFERRLIYQLLRTSYPGLVANSNYPGTMRISKANGAEGEERTEAMRRRNAAVFSEQFGFSWIAKALQGADISEFDVTVLSRNPGVIGATYTPHAYAEQFEKIRRVLEGRPTILVGHNCFIDLIFFYQCFCGHLPDSVEAFAASISNIFPLVIDTKYLATAHPDTADARDSQLWQINERLAADERISVSIDTPHEHETYESSTKYHEAGYDSYVTAIAFLRLSSKLGVAGGYVDAASATFPALKSTYSASASNATNKSKPKRKTSSPKTKDELSGGKFFHKNMFDNLNQEAGGDASLPGSTSTETSVALSNGSTSISNGTRKRTKSKCASGRIPPWTNEFWRDHGNKLRVYGTKEEVCELKPIASAADRAGDGPTSASAGFRVGREQAEKRAETQEERLELSRRTSLLDLTGIKKILRSFS